MDLLVSNHGVSEEQIMQKTALTVAALIFCLVAIAHFLRFFLGLDVMIGEAEVSLQLSAIAGCFTGILAIWMYLASRRA